MRLLHSILLLDQPAQPADRHLRRYRFLLLQTPFRPTSNAEKPVPSGKCHVLNEGSPAPPATPCRCRKKHLVHLPILAIAEFAAAHHMNFFLLRLYRQISAENRDC